jgi:hypothetical protein
VSAFKNVFEGNDNSSDALQMIRTDRKPTPGRAVAASPVFNVSQTFCFQPATKRRYQVGYASSKLRNARMQQQTAQRSEEICMTHNKNVSDDALRTAQLVGSAQQPTAAIDRDSPLMVGTG